MQGLSLSWREPVAMDQFSKHLFWSSSPSNVCQNKGDMTTEGHAPLWDSRLLQMKTAYRTCAVHALQCFGVDSSVEVHNIYALKVTPLPEKSTKYPRSHCLLDRTAANDSFCLNCMSLSCLLMHFYSTPVVSILQNKRTLSNCFRDTLHVALWNCSHLNASQIL